MIKLDTNMQIDAPQGLFMTTQIQYTIKIALSVQLLPSSILEFVGRVWEQGQFRRSCSISPYNHASV